MDERIRSALLRVGRLLVQPGGAATLVPPRLGEEGFWFGGGNMTRGADGALWLVGRYRNGGDSRTGVEAGPRGAELALLTSKDEGRSFQPAFSFLKGDLACEGEEVLSIEGASLCSGRKGVELYVSSEKKRSYPERVRSLQKAGTGVWSVDVLAAQGFDGLKGAPVRRALRSEEPAWLHVKDPVVFDMAGRRTMLYCCHPYCWSSSNTGCATAEGPRGGWVSRSRSILERGPAWDVAVFRVTARLPLPAVGVLKGCGGVSLYFYDGAECIHKHEGSHPKGYSCEEIGGLAAGLDEEFPRIERLSVEGALFVSPHGTGCNRYVSVFEGEDYYLATWQQSQPDRSQPLVSKRTPKAEVEALLAE